MHAKVGDKYSRCIRPPADSSAAGQGSQQSRRCIIRLVLARIRCAAPLGRTVSKVLVCLITLVIIALRTLFFLSAC